MHKLKAIKEKLVECIEEQMNNLDCVNTKELGKVIDMVKDLEEAMYYCCKIHMMCCGKHEEEGTPTYETKRSITETSSTTIV